MIGVTAALNYESFYLINSSSSSRWLELLGSALLFIYSDDQGGQFWPLAGQAPGGANPNGGGASINGTCCF